MIKMIVMDMDGTLLTSENVIDEVTKKTLLDMEKRGIQLVLASGRSYRKLLKYAKELQMALYGGFLIEINGLAVYDLQHQTRNVKTRLTLADIKKLFEFGLPYELEMQALFDDGIFIHIPKCLIPDKIKYRKEHHLPQDFPWTRGAMNIMHDNREGYPKQTYIETVEEITRPVNKICYAAPKEELDAFVKDLRHRFGNEYWMGKTTECWLEIMPKGITKGNTLLELADQLQLQQDEILAFGDGENDIEMLRAVTYGIAMGNALENVKQAAYDVTDDNHHQGIAKAIKKYVS